MLVVGKGELAFFDCAEENKIDLDAGSFVGEIKCFVDEGPLTTSLKAKIVYIIFFY